jgi:hypothetical protein
LEEEDQWEDHEIDGKMSYRGMQLTFSGFGTGRRLGRSWSENGPKLHRKRRRV